MVFNYGLSGIIAPDLAEIGRRARAFRMPGLFWPVTANGREAGHGPHRTIESFRSRDRHHERD